MKQRVTEAADTIYLALGKKIEAGELALGDDLRYEISDYLSNVYVSLLVYNHQKHNDELLAAMVEDAIEIFYSTDLDSFLTELTWRYSYELGFRE